MNNSKPADRRKHQRYPLATSISFHHCPTQRDFPGRSVDISEGGLLMYVPATVPVHAGQYISVRVGGTGRPEFAGHGEDPINATVVRVDRHQLLAVGHIAVGVQFQTNGH